MSLGPTIIERLARARADLRMGVPVVLTADGQAALIAAVETLSPDRLIALRRLGTPELAITARRAETLKARAYDYDLARIMIPGDAGLPWLRAVADPADDLADGRCGTPDDGPSGRQPRHPGTWPVGRCARRRQRVSGQAPGSVP